MILTPRVLRRASQRLSYGSFLGDALCLRCRHFTQQPIVRRRPVLPQPISPRFIQKRTIFDLFKSDPRDVPIPAHRQNAGIPVLATLCRYLDERIGFEPTIPELIKAFHLIVNDKSQRSLLRDDGNAYGMIRLLEVLKERDESVRLQDKDLELAMKSIGPANHEFAVHLAGMLLDLVKESDKKGLIAAGVKAMVIALATQGDVFKAMQFIDSGQATYGEDVVPMQLWLDLMSTLVNNSNEEGARAVMESCREKRIPLEAQLHDYLIQLYLKRDEAGLAEQQWTTMLENKTTPFVQTYSRILEYSVKHPKDLTVSSWLKDTFEHFEKVQLTQDTFDEVTERSKRIMWLKWLLIKGHSGDHLTQTILGMKTSTGQPVEPDIETINELVAFAIWKQDVTAAKMLFMLSDRWNLQHNRQSQILQISLRMLSNDPEGAVSAWQNLRYFEAGPDDEGAETINLLALMSSNIGTDIDVIKQIYQDVLKRNLYLDVDTLSVLLDYHLQKSDIQTLIPVMTREINTYIMEDRQKIIKVLGEHVGRPDVDVEDAFRLYECMKEIFLEMPMSVRKDFMQLFFSRERSDMGRVVFLHMRISSSARPDADAYTIAFRNMAKLQDPHGLVEVHNFFKIDPDVVPNTDLYNSLMWAYNCTNWPTKAMDVFKQITLTDEGPDSDTLSLAMISCGLIPVGMHTRGEIIWKNFRKLGIPLTHHNYAMRITGWILNKEYDKAWKIAKTMDKEDGMRPDQTVLMALYSEMPRSMQPDIEQWAKEMYPAEWKALEEDPEEPLQKLRERQKRTIGRENWILV